MKLILPQIIFPTGVSIESASYIENNNLEENESLVDKVEEMKVSIHQNYFLKIKAINQMMLQN